MRPFPDLDAPLSDGVISLRRFTLDDVADVTRALQDPEIMRWTASIPTPYTESNAIGWIEGQAQLWHSGKTALFAVDSAPPRVFLGNINVIVPPDADGRAAMMYWIARWGRGRGIATRSLLLSSKWAMEVLNPPELFLETLEGNVASERVAEKAGYVFAGYRSKDFTRPASRGTPEKLVVRQ
jgi:RimJ/RimL family protein N-acetyltransferase